MVLRFIVLGFLAISSTANASELSPWFGSDASQPAQISVQIRQDTQKTASNDAVVCTISGCLTNPKLAQPRTGTKTSP